MESFPPTWAGSPDTATTLVELQRLTDAALSYLSLNDLLAELLNRIVEIVDTDTAAILLLDEAGQAVHARAAKGIEEEVHQGVSIPLGRGFAGRIAAERRAIAIADVDHADILNPILREKGIRSLLGVPLLVEGRVIGVLHVGTLAPRVFSEEHIKLLQLAADRAALAIEHGRLSEQRAVVEALQRTLLPGRLPEIPGLALTARYRPGAAQTSIGGDWYDVFKLPGGMIGLAVGDVVGRGTPAAALMAQLRTALRAYAREGDAPAAVMKRLNALLREFTGGAMTTLAYAVLDPARHEVSVVSAGHPPPLLIPPAGEPAYLPVEGDLALGVSTVVFYHERRFPMPEGASLVLFTDGAVEVRGEGLDTGLERLRRLPARDLRADALCDAILELSADRSSDDVAVLVAEMLPLGRRLVTGWPADVAILADVRHLLRRWLRQQGANSDEAYDLTVACLEACTNAIEHAYAPGPAAFEVEAVSRSGEIEITVRDRGRWRPPRGRHRGRGRGIMELLTDSVEISPEEDGTAVILRRALAVARDG